MFMLIQFAWVIKKCYLYDKSVYTFLKEITSTKHENVLVLKCERRGKVEKNTYVFLYFRSCFVSFCESVPTQNRDQSSRAHFQTNQPIK